MSTRVLAIVATVAVLLAVGLYGGRAGWFTSSSGDGDDFVPPDTNRLGVTPPREYTPNEKAIAFADWESIGGSPVVGVGSEMSDAAPPHAVLSDVDGRAVVGIRVPAKKSDGKPYIGYSLQVRVGDSRVWGTYVPRKEARDASALLRLSLNLAQFQPLVGVGQEVSVIVGGTAMRKGDTLGIVRLELPKTS